MSLAPAAPASWVRFTQLDKKQGACAPYFFANTRSYDEKEEPQPQVVVAFGFLMTN